MKITLHSDNQTAVTSVPNTFIDEYMTEANGEFVKVYLYLLRLMNTPDATFSISSIADRFEHTEKDIRRALAYWERMQLLRLEYDDTQNLVGVCMLDSAVQRAEETVPVPDAAPLPLSPAPVMPAVVPKRSYSADDIYRFQQDEAVVELLFITERYLKRPLTPTDTNTILYIYDGLGFSAELIEYLVEYCVSRGHTSIRYIEKVAIAWAESHVTSVEEAKQASGSHSRSVTAVMKEFGISGRNLVPAETSFLEKWKSEYGSSDELIAEACRRTMQALHQPNFAYADSILSGWSKKQVRSARDLAALDAEHQSQKRSRTPGGRNAAGDNPAGGASNRNRFNNFSQRSYDYDELEQILLTTSAK